MPDLSFDHFMEQRRRVAAAFVNGDPEPLRKISAADDPATIFGPHGGVAEGAAHVLEANKAGSLQFHGGTTELEVLHSGSDRRFAYWTGWQRAMVRVKGQEEPVPMRLRVTEIFRRDGDAWKMIHRHADTLAEKEPSH